MPFQLRPFLCMPRSGFSLLSAAIHAMGDSKHAVARARLGLTSQHLRPNRCFSTGVSAEKVASVDLGRKYTAGYKNYAVREGTRDVVSYFHDVPLDFDEASKTANMVVEIPRWSNAKFEISTKLPGNPIVQDVKKGQVRFVKNLFPHHGYIHNYGAFPQTWEDPTSKHADLDLYGDNDPLDVCEIGSTVLKTGDVKRVKILGSLAMIDDGELDWKVIVVDVIDPLSQELFDIHHVFVKCPGLLETTRQWFRDYKLADGKPENEFAFNGKYRSQKETVQTLLECNRAWKRLVNREIKGDNLPIVDNASLADSPGFLSSGFALEELLKVAPEDDAPIPSEIDKSHFLGTG